MQPDITATHVALKRVTEGAAFRSAYRAAASNGHDTITIAEALEAYQAEGTPGRSIPSIIWDRLEALQEQSEGQVEKSDPTSG